MQHVESYVEKITKTASNSSVCISPENQINDDLTNNKNWKIVNICQVLTEYKVRVVTVVYETKNEKCEELWINNKG